MNIFFMRHGEATDNVKGLISDKEIYWSILTDKGKIDVKNTLNNMEAMYYTCNHMKSDILKTDFLEHISKIYKHNFN